MSAESIPESWVPGPSREEDAAMRALTEMAKGWARHPELGFSVIGTSLATVVPCQRAYLLRWLPPGGELEVAGTYAGVEGSLELGQRVEQDQQDADLVEETPEVMICSDTAVWLTALERQLAAEGMRSALTAVLRLRRQVVGLLVVASAERMAYGAREVRLLRKMAPALVGHLRHWELKE